MSDPSDLRSVHTTTLPEVLRQFGISVLVSTYQAGKLVVVREENGTANTHFRNFRSPMGLALDGGRLAVGTKTDIQEFHDQPAAAARLEPAGRYDALFLPRASHTTGQVAVHEMEFAGDELWFVNTRFSCLCTLDRNSSFVPRWRPAFVTALAPEDRCHLNGLAVVGGAPKSVTALGATDSNADWRANKARGGVLLDVPSGEFVARGLSMPHSPRWYRGKLWVCESGAGTLGTVDPATGKLDVVAELPGFTRGLDFFGNLAFVGLSQVRESALFSGIPITDRLPVEERACGMWVVDIDRGQTVAFLRFEAGVQEVFAVRVLPGARFPELLNEPGDEAIENSFVLPDEALKDAPGAVRV
ncbi:MAG: TIGR03032 family protein [Gemmataceae bacterium]